MPTARYSRTFFEDMVGRSEASARRVVPIVMDLVHPTSVLDVGCGTGAWLRTFLDAGVATCRGVDGSSSDAGVLRVPPELVTVADLTQPLELGSFDLVVSLEVAEHLDAGLADGFVATLAHHAPVVLFSAAVPYQGGTHHVNEQWPSYWSDRFACHDYLPVDAIRYRVWDDPDVETHYAQNTLLYAHRDVLESSPVLQAERLEHHPLDVVHPMLYQKKMRHPVLLWLDSKLPDSTRIALRARARRLRPR